MLDAAEQRLLSITQGLPDLLHVEQEHLRLLTDSPGYASFFLTYFDRFERLLKAKPVLIQGMCSPQDLLRNLIICLMRKPCINVSSRMCRARSMEALRCSDAPQQDCGTRSIARILDAHGTVADTRIACPRSARLFFYLFFFAQESHTVSLTLTANHAELENFIRCLGLQSVRARRLIILSASYLEHFHDKPEQPRSQDPSTSISHLPGSGPYALDSYRIYCGGPDAWRTVMPRDKELIRFIVSLFCFFALEVIRYHI